MGGGGGRGRGRGDVVITGCAMCVALIHNQTARRQKAYEKNGHMANYSEVDRRFKADEGGGQRD